MPYRSVFRDDLFAGKTLIVTGGGSGIGRCTAHELAALGARVVLLGRKEDKLKAVADEIREDTGREALFFTCDIRDEDKVRDTVAAIYKQVQQVDIRSVSEEQKRFHSGVSCLPTCLHACSGWEG